MKLRWIRLMGMLIKIKNKKSFTMVLLPAVFALAILGIYIGHKHINTYAADLSKFDPGNIMSDSVMRNKNSMTESEIQRFLNSKNRCNNTNIHLAKLYPNVRYNIKDGKFVCMAQDSFNGESAARIIWQAAQDFSINPQVLIVLLEKEQGLITDTWPHSIQYRSATGYGCPDTAACDSKYYGLKNQIRMAASLFNNVLNGGWSNYPVGNNYVQFHPNVSCGGTIVNIKNRATSALYRYTPYQPNQAALSAGYGHGNSCSAYGNRNFWQLFTDWFGSTTRDPYPVNNPILERYQAESVKNTLGAPESSMLCGLAAGGCKQSFERGAIYSSAASGVWENSGRIRTRYNELGAERSVLGYPTSSEINTENSFNEKGVYQRFQNGYIIGKTSTGYWENYGPIRQYYSKFGFERGELGYPIARVNSGKNNGHYQRFEYGYIIGKASTGYWESRGSIRNRYAKDSFENGKFGYPTGPEISLATGGYRQSFENGAILGKWSTGYWEVWGSIGKLYTSLGLNDSNLGYPISDEEILPDGRIRQKFEKGYIIGKSGEYKEHLD